MDLPDSIWDIRKANYCINLQTRLGVDWLEGHPDLALPPSRPFRDAQTGQVLYDPSGRDVFGEWLARLRDVRTQAKIITRIDRLAAGNFGDCRSLEGGVFELRIDWGPGYRVYYAMIGSVCVLLLCGGDKRTQSSDIQRAQQYLKDYRTRTT